MTYITIGRTTHFKDPWHTAKDVAINEQKRTVCEVCHHNQATDAHHAIVRRDKNCKAVDNIINLQMVCHSCHMSGKADGWKNTVRAIQDAVKRYGADEVEKWLEELAELGKQVQEQYNQVRR